MNFISRFFKLYKLNFLIKYKNSLFLLLSINSKILSKSFLSFKTINDLAILSFSLIESNFSLVQKILSFRDKNFELLSSVFSIDIQVILSLNFSNSLLSVSISDSLFSRETVIILSPNKFILDSINFLKN